MDIVCRSIVPKIKLISLSFNIINARFISSIVYCGIQNKGYLPIYVQYMMNDLRFFEIIQQKRK